jgi:hypothetical protein
MIYVGVVEIGDTREYICETSLFMIYKSQGLLANVPLPSKPAFSNSVGLCRLPSSSVAMISALKVKAATERE